MTSPHDVEVSTTNITVDNAPPILPPKERITVAEVESTIKCLQNMKAPGFDGIFIICIKRLQNWAMTLLAAIFNSCLSLNIFPQVWKSAKVIPILKPGKDPTLLFSYCPISLLRTFSKLFEKIIYRRLRNSVNDLQIILAERFGFRSGHSTTHQLIRLQNTIQQKKKTSIKTHCCCDARRGKSIRQFVA